LLPLGVLGFAVLNGGVDSYLLHQQFAVRAEHEN
jgi:hypothetical protein